MPGLIGAEDNTGREGPGPARGCECLPGWRQGVREVFLEVVAERRLGNPALQVAPVHTLIDPWLPSFPAGLGECDRPLDEDQRAAGGSDLPGCGARPSRALRTVHAIVSMSPTTVPRDCPSSPPWAGLQASLSVGSLATGPSRKARGTPTQEDISQKSGSVLRRNSRLTPPAGGGLWVRTGSSPTGHRELDRSLDGLSLGVTGQDKAWDAIG